MMNDWISALSEEFAVSGEVNIDAVLDLARVVAHEVERPAVPVTMYLLGLAIAAGEPFDLAVAKTYELAQTWKGENPINMVH